MISNERFLPNGAGVGGAAGSRADGGAAPDRKRGGVIPESLLVLTDVATDCGITGHSIVFTYTAAALKPTADLIHNLEPLETGHALAPIEIEQQLAKRFRLLGTWGLVGMALAAVDMALWDAAYSGRIRTAIRNGSDSVPIRSGHRSGASGQFSATLSRAAERDRGKVLLGGGDAER